MTLQQHTERQWRGVAGPDRSAGAGVKSLIAVDFRNRMTDSVLKQQCLETRIRYENYSPQYCDCDRCVRDAHRRHVGTGFVSLVGAGEHL